jgi:hypothetical protein
MACYGDSFTFFFTLPLTYAICTQGGKHKIKHSKNCEREREKIKEIDAQQSIIVNS